MHKWKDKFTKGRRVMSIERPTRVTGKNDFLLSAFWLWLSESCAWYLKRGGYFASDRAR